MKIAVKDLLPTLQDYGRRHARRFMLFGFVGVLNTIVDYSVYTMAYFLGAPPAAANIIAFGATNPFSYGVNSRVTFRRNGKAAPLSWRGYGKFLSAHLLSLVISTLVVFFLATRVGPFWAKAAAIFVTVFINYGASALLVFNDTDTPDPAGDESP